MRLDFVDVEMFDVDVNPERVLMRVTVGLPHEALGHGVWRAGRSIRLETTGAGDRAHLEEAFKFVLDQLEKEER